MGASIRSIPHVLVLALLFVSSGSQAAAPDSNTAGQRIYRDGLNAAGEPIKAQREPGMQMDGGTAACLNCHRRSGLGMSEGRTTIPPIAGMYLFHPRAGSVDDLDLPFVPGMKADRDPYTDTTLARAIRAGIGADGKPLSYLMPRYELDDAQMGSLITYLKGLSAGAVPGVTGSVLHFATIITPDSDPVARQGMLDVLDKFFVDKNHYVRGEQPRLRSSRRMMFKVNRHWQLHVWELTGPPDGWQGQLRAHLAAEPVFAVISGIGGRNWAPVHQFCEAQSLPCLFPNVDVPEVAENDFDNLYLSKGVLLEAQLMAHELREQRAPAKLRRVVQVFRGNDVGRAAAESLAALLSGSGLVVTNRTLSGDAGHALAAAMKDLSETDALVVWLRPADLGAIGSPPSRLSEALLSGRMSGLEHAPLPAAWRTITKMSYPFDLPERRRVRLDYPLGWFRIRQIPLVAEQVQTDTYLVCGLVSDTLNHMADTFVRDYLVERIEEMLEHRVITGYYPRLALAPGQSFASKGGYIVRFSGREGTRVVAEGDWIVP